MQWRYFNDSANEHRMRVRQAMCCSWKLQPPFAYSLESYFSSVFVADAITQLIVFICHLNGCSKYWSRLTWNVLWHLPAGDVLPPTKIAVRLGLEGLQPHEEQEPRPPRHRLLQGLPQPDLRRWGLRLHQRILAHGWDGPSAVLPSFRSARAGVKQLSFGVGPKRAAWMQSSAMKLGLKRTEKKIHRARGKEEDKGSVKRGCKKKERIGIQREILAVISLSCPQSATLEKIRLLIPSLSQQLEKWVMKGAMGSRGSVLSRVYIWRKAGERVPCALWWELR